MGLAESAEAAEPAGLATDGLHVEVVYASGPGQVDVVPLRLAAGACVADALRCSGLLQRHGLAAGPAGGLAAASDDSAVGTGEDATPAPGTLRVGVWGRLQPLTHPLRDRDRVEVYRPLQVDPKEARRLRYAQHRERIAAMVPRLKPGGATPKR